MLTDVRTRAAPHTMVRSSAQAPALRPWRSLQRRWSEFGGLAIERHDISDNCRYVALGQINRSRQRSLQPLAHDAMLLQQRLFRRLRLTKLMKAGARGGNYYACGDVRSLAGKLGILGSSNTHMMKCRVRQG